MELSQFLAQAVAVVLLSGFLFWLQKHPEMFPTVECAPEADEDDS